MGAYSRYVCSSLIDPQFSQDLIPRIDRVCSQSSRELWVSVMPSEHPLTDFPLIYVHGVELRSEYA